MSAARFQILAQTAAPAEDIEDIIELEADPAPAAPGDLIELKDPPAWTGWYWIGGGLWLFVALLVFLLTRKKKTGATVAEPALPAHQRALEALRQAWDDQASLGDKQFVTALSDALRQYIETEFAVRAPERTTEEFLEEASHHEDLKGEFAARLEEFLSWTDLVKFAKLPLSPEQRQELYAASVKFVEESHQARMLKIAPELSASARMEEEAVTR